MQKKKSLNDWEYLERLRCKQLRATVHQMHWFASLGSDTMHFVNRMDVRYLAVVKVLEQHYRWKTGAAEQEKRKKQPHQMNTNDI